MELGFFGAAGTVTGSKYHLRTGRTQLLVDCGLFQGPKQLRLRNWQPLPFDASRLDAVLLTHAHLDHSGALPLLARAGFTGKIYATAPTRDLCRVLLLDAAYLEEEAAAFAARHGFSKHRTPLPLFTTQDAERALALFRAVRFDEPLELPGGVVARFRHAGHILGAASIHVGDGSTSVFFSGDLGRPDDLIMRPPEPPLAADHQVVESTYGDRHHLDHDPLQELAQAVTRAIARGGVMLVPAFSVARAQTVLFRLHLLKAQGRIPKDLPVFLDSPMAMDVTELYIAHEREHRLSSSECAALGRVAKFVRSAEESKGLDQRTEPMVIVAGSGMVTGGRILHHLKVFAPDERNMVLLTGFQAPGTRGAALAAGADSIKIHGQYVPVRAEVVSLEGLSGHADGSEVIEWLRSALSEPEGVFVTHGEAVAADTLRRRIQEELRWPARVPEHGEVVKLG